MSVRRGKSFCESHVKLKQIKVPSTPMNKVTMRSFFHATDSNHDAVSFDFCNDNTMNSYVCKNINNTSNVNAFMELNDSLLTAQPNGSITILAPKTTPATSKPRVPDILMINKYYGLIPQKFAISSRKPPGSTPSSAHGSRGTTKSNSSKPRAKSSTHHRHPEGRGYEKLKGCRSDNDSPEPIKLGVISRNGSLDHSSSTSEGQSFFVRLN
ncbi:unnamed protein product [Orchesella dallaii]|uniref:Uncharacterized protein n=1 Tax=Orchesella dallaii TaxID=48710 RepID=A0ABP1QC90_9HEXA